MLAEGELHRCLPSLAEALGGYTVAEMVLHEVKGCLKVEPVLLLRHGRTLSQQNYFPKK